MRIAPYWHRAHHKGPGPLGRTFRATCYGWSFDSPEQAKAHAEERAKLAFERLCQQGHHGRHLSNGFEYYPDLPIREEILERHQLGEGSDTLISRNRYGAMVLNSPSVFITDVDFAAGAKLGGLLGLLISLSRGKSAAETSQEQLEAEERIQQWCDRAPNRGVRLYRTAAGLRLIATDGLVTPNGNEAAQRFEELGADPLYRRLTERQECFRARLTPKPWRCGMRSLPAPWPWANERQAGRAATWIKRYEKTIARYRVCDLITSYGPEARDPTIRATLALHDERCGVERQAPLA